MIISLGRSPAISYSSKEDGSSALAHYNEEENSSQVKYGGRQTNAQRVTSPQVLADSFSHMMQMQGNFSL